MEVKRASVTRLTPHEKVRLILGKFSNEPRAMRNGFHAVPKETDDENNEKELESFLKRDNF